MFPIAPMLSASLIIAGPPPTLVPRTPLTFARIYKLVDEQSFNKIHDYDLARLDYFEPHCHNDAARAIPPPLAQNSTREPDGGPLPWAIASSRAMGIQAEPV